MLLSGVVPCSDGTNDNKDQNRKDARHIVNLLIDRQRIHPEIQDIRISGIRRLERSGIGTPFGYKVYYPEVVEVSGETHDQKRCGRIHDQREGDVTEALFLGSAVDFRRFVKRPVDTDHYAAHQSHVIREAEPNIDYNQGCPHEPLVVRIMEPLNVLFAPIEEFRESGRIFVDVSAEHAEVFQQVVNADRFQSGVEHAGFVENHIEDHLGNNGRNRPRQDEQGPPEFLKRHVIVVDNQSLEETAEENRHRGENRPNDRPKEDTPKDFAKRNGDIADASEAEDIDEIAETDPVEQTDVRFVIGEGGKEAENNRHNRNKGDKKNGREQNNVFKRTFVYFFEVMTVAFAFFEFHQMDSR